MSVNRASSIKHRRTRREMGDIRDMISMVVEENAPMTVRQVFYQLVSRGAIAKTENEYNQTVVRLLTDMRVSGEISFSDIADNTRWMRKPRSFSSLEAALRLTAETYRRATWDNQPVYVEVWLEKDALAGVVFGETGKWDVPLMVTRGYASVSYLYEAAETIRECGKPAYLYYLGDHDPSGIDIPRNVEARLRQFAPEADIHFERLAVTPEQITEWNLPTRPTKGTDTRAKRFVGESVEVDAIPPGQLRTLVRDAIEWHVDPDALMVLRMAEASEREVLASLLPGDTA